MRMKKNKLSIRFNNKKTRQSKQNNCPPKPLALFIRRSRHPMDQRKTNIPIRLKPSTRSSNNLSLRIHNKTNPVSQKFLMS